MAPTTRTQREHDQQSDRKPATGNHGTDRRSGGFGRPDVAETATSRVAICNNHRPPTSPRGRARNTAASDLPATIPTRRRPSTRSSASIRSSGRSSLASAAAPEHDCARTEHDRDQCRGHEDQQRDDGKRDRWPVPSAASSDGRRSIDSKPGSSSFVGEETFVRA